MDCHKTQEEILSSLEGRLALEIQQEIDRHLLDCPACQAFAAKQKTLDARLAATLVLPAMSPGFRTGLRRRVRRETVRARVDSLPELVHFGSCGLATLLCVVLLPYPAFPSYSR